MYNRDSAMGTLNIAEWSPEQVAEWMSGLGPKVEQYVPELHKKGLNGAKLLTLRCDDLEYLGIHIIGHQELLLEAVEHLRNFHYELTRECVQQLALRVSSAANSLARALRHHIEARLETHSLADVARTVHAVKPLVCWLDRWPLCSGSPLAERKAALLKLSLEAATCAQRDRFAEQPARAVAAAAAAVAAVADYIIQDVSDPTILQPASLDGVSLRQGERALGFEVVPSFCGHHQLAHIRFASPAHASGLVHEADEIVQVGGKCVIGWSGEAVERACAEAARASGELQLRLRRRGARALPALPTPPLRAPRPARLRLPPLHAHHAMHRYEIDFPRVEMSLPEKAVERQLSAGAGSSSDESEPLSPPASPTQLHLDTARLYPPKPLSARARRHSVCGGSPRGTRHARPPLAVQRFWQELQQQRFVNGGSPEPDDSTLYRRDKAVSCSTGLQLSPRPRTCLGVPRPIGTQNCGQISIQCQSPTPTQSRGKLDKSHSTPAYDFEPSSEPGSLAAQTIPESPTTPTTDGPTLPQLEKAGQILDFKKSSTQIEEAIQQRNRKTVADEEKSEIFTDDDIKPIDEDSKLEIVETVNTIISENVRISERLVSREMKRFDSDESNKLSPKVSTDDTSSDEHIPISVKYPKPRITERYRPSDIPPEPPPRPSFTQRSPPMRELPPPPRELPPPSRELPPPPRELPPPPRELPLPPRDLPLPPRDLPLPPRDPPVPLPRDCVPARSRARVSDSRDSSPLKPLRPGDSTQPRSISKQDIRLVRAERRLLPALNAHAPPGDAPAPAPPPAARGLFPTSKSRSLKKKNSILAKRRSVSARSLAARGAAGRVWQRVRARGAAQPRWAARHLLLAHNLLYAYRSPECNRADCMIYLEGFTVCAAGEVKSREHAFKVYHTGTAFYFACDSRDAMLAWIQLIHRATLLPSLLSSAMELSKQFSETDYSETESDTDNAERKNDKDREKEKEREKEKSKFGSLKKLTHRAGRSESHENVNQAAATSLDRKYLRFFSRARSKDDTKSGKRACPGVAPTEHYRSYRRASPPAPAPRLAAPINYIHASNPNLLDFEKSDFVTKPAVQVPKPKVHKPDNFVGFVTLEEFMLKKQEEERRQVYSNRVLLGVEERRARELQRRLARVVPDVVYGELEPRAAHGYEKIVYPADSPRREEERRGSLRRHRVHSGSPHTPPPQPQQTPSESSGGGGASGGGSGGVSGGGSGGASGGGSGSGGGATGGVSRLRLMFGARRELQRQESERSEQYPHLQCPPTFQPESYSLARPPRP